MGGEREPSIQHTDMQWNSVPLRELFRNMQRPLQNCIDGYLAPPAKWTPSK